MKNSNNRFTVELPTPARKGSRVSYELRDGRVSVHVPRYLSEADARLVTEVESDTFRAAMGAAAEVGGEIHDEGADRIAAAREDALAHVRSLFAGTDKRPGLLGVDGRVNEAVLTSIRERARERAEENERDPDEAEEAAYRNALKRVAKTEQKASAYASAQVMVALCNVASDSVRESRKEKREARATRRPVDRQQVEAGLKARELKRRLKEADLPGEFEETGT